jgi:YrbI family 3-deoxy-D-manno-octulosonate 8-phosphate phosphatase
MANIAIIPARGGSKGIPNKNLQSIAGQSLISRTISSAIKASTIDLIFVSSDCKNILLEASLCGAIPIMRPSHLSTDTASTDPVLEHALDYIDTQGIQVNVAVLLQCTSVFTQSIEIDAVVNALLSSDDAFDAAFAASEFHSFIWSYNASTGRFRGINHDSSQPRIRRQDIDEIQLRELGSVYAFYRNAFKLHPTRFCSSPLPVKVNSLNEYLEIDSIQDLLVARRIYSLLDTISTPPISFKAINTLVMDFDGVFTNNKSITYFDGEEVVYCSKLDSQGISLLLNLGINILVLTSEMHDSVKRRLEKLKLDYIQTPYNKGIALHKYMAECGLSRQSVCYVGNDVNDNTVLKLVGILACPSDASTRTRAISHYVSAYSGGNGCIRDICDKIIADSIASARLHND